MRDIELVCVTCGKVDLGNGIWSDIDSQSKRKKRKGLCPDCSLKRFPQFYDDYKSNNRRQFFLFRLPLILLRFFKGKKGVQFRRTPY
jgi:DNA-directed RNA polymerase subunit RPC12/RpoP